MVIHYYKANVLKPGNIYKNLWEKEKYFHFAENTTLKTIENFSRFDYLETCDNTGPHSVSISSFILVLFL